MRRWQARGILAPEYDPLPPQEPTQRSSSSPGPSLPPDWYASRAVLLGMIACGVALGSDEGPAVAAVAVAPILPPADDPPPAIEPPAEEPASRQGYAPVRAPGYARTPEEAEEALRLQVPVWIEEAARSLRVPAPLVSALIAVESRHHTRARSGTGCRGLMQVGGRWDDHRPVVVRFGLHDDPDDPRTNVFVGTWILRRMMRTVRRSRFASRDDWIKAVIASYNVGQRIVLRAAEAARGLHGRRPTWRQTYRQISPRLLASEPAYSNGRWHDGEDGTWSRASKVDHLGAFVQGVYRRYRRASRRM